MNRILLLATSVVLMCFTSLTHAQAPVLGESASFALFSSDGAVSNIGAPQLTLITGNVGTQNGPNNNFGNVDGVMHNADGTTAIASADLILASNQLAAATPTDFPAPLLGNGQVLEPGTYSIGEVTTLDGILTLDGLNDPNAVFIFKIGGAFSTTSGSQVVLINGAQACNVFWRTIGLIDIATMTQMRGTLVADNAAIVMGVGASLEGRALAVNGAVTVQDVTVTIPLGCGTPPNLGPIAPQLNSVVCYAIFTGNEDVMNAGISNVVGDVGTNNGATTGFQDENVDGTIHENPDTSTQQASVDLNNAHAYLTALPVDIELLYPALFGNDLVLTPHTYLLNAATVLTGTVYLNAQDNVDAVFVIKIVGALTTSVSAAVVLQNGAQAKNVFWIIEGATTLNNDVDFRGTLVNTGGIILNTGVTIEGRVLATTGSITTTAIDAQMTPGCETLSIGENTTTTKSAHFYPNPFTSTLSVKMDDFDSAELTIYNSLGVLVLKTTMSGTTTTIPTNLSSGIYLYRLNGKDGSVQSGKLIAN